MALDLTKVFKGIQQVKALPATPEKGVIYFVREHVDGKPTGNASVYFGERLYGNVEATRLAKIESDILSLDGRVDAIEGALGKWTEEFVGNLQTVASVVKGHATTLGNHSERLDAIESDFAENIGSGFDKDNSVSDNIDRLDNLIGEGFANDGSDITAEILKIKESLEPEGDTAMAIAAAQKKADDAYVLADAAQTADEVSAAIDTKIAGLNSASHTHENKALLDTYTQTEANLADAVSKKHEHTNKTELDSIQSGDKAKWDGHVANTDIHVTTDDKAKWNKVSEKANQSDLTAHTGNGDIHVTAEQKTAWQEATDAINAFLATESDTTAAIDTLKEIQDFLTSDDGTVETLLNKVDALEKSLAEDGDTAKAIAAAQTAADAAQADVDALEEVVDAIAADYLKGADKTELEGKITAAQKKADDAYALADAARTEEEVDEQIDAKIEGLNEASHTHDNKDVLDTIKNIETDKFENIIAGDESKTVATVNAIKSYVSDEIAANAIYYGGDDAEYDEEI